MNPQRRELAGRDEEPVYVISIAARMLGVHQQTLRYYERAGLITPRRSRGNIRLYSHADLEHVRRAQRLIDQLGVNLAGVEIILRMGQRIRDLEERLAEAEARMARPQPQLAGPISREPEDNENAIPEAENRPFREENR